MTDAYGTALKAVKDSLETLVKTTSSFDVYAYSGYRQKPGGYPNAQIKLRNDSFEARGPNLTWHLTTFDIRIENYGEGTEANLDDMIDYAGEIVDVIEANRTMSTTYVENTEVTNISYSLSPRPQSVFLYAIMTVEVQHMRSG